MVKHPIEPSRIKQPFQLLAAWLAALLALDSAFLLAAANIKTPTWAPAALVIASIGFVPLFAAIIFLLQTRFRPQM